MMAKESAGQGDGTGQAALIAALTDLGRARAGPAPVHLWNPPFCGDIDMRIARDGTWFYGGTPIGRPALVKLFASVLRKDEDRFVLVTPVEKVGIVVEDVPFLAVELGPTEDLDAKLRLRTNVEDWVSVDSDHPLRFEPGAAGALTPYVRVRGELWARVVRSVFYELVALGETRDVDGVATFGIGSGPAFFPMMAASGLDIGEGEEDQIFG